MIRSLLGVLLAAFVLLGLSSVARADNCPLLGIYNDDAVTLGAGQQACGMGGTRTGGSFHPMGVIFESPSPAATATGTTQQTLATYSLPANAFDSVGRVLRCTAAYSFGSNTHNKQVGIAFGSEVLDLASAAYNGTVGVLQLTAIKQASSVQIVYGQANVPSGGPSPATATYEATGSEIDTAAVTINFNALDGTSAAQDVVLNNAMCEFMN